MFVAPQPGCQYRDTRTKQLVPVDGFEADEKDLDVARAVACGDLVEVERPAPEAAEVKAPAKSRSKSKAAPEEPPALPLTEPDAEA